MFENESRLHVSCGTLSKRRSTCYLIRLREDRDGQGWSPKVFFLKIRMEPSKIVVLPAWCSKMRLTTVVHLSPLPR
ncbi:hypothetical protein TNCV_265451 [Trichonephila clavipes]|nr:hypothetical protein TNCV_265451 [Trichonephila clavipes]